MNKQQWNHVGKQNNIVESNKQLIGWHNTLLVLWFCSNFLFKIILFLTLLFAWESVWIYFSVEYTVFEPPHTITWGCLQKGLQKIWYGGWNKNHQQCKYCIRQFFNINKNTQKKTGRTSLRRQWSSFLCLTNWKAVKTVLKINLNNQKHRYNLSNLKH